LPSSLAQELLGHVRAELPNEGCGLLSGTGDGRAKAYHPARNADASPFRFRLQDEDLVAITFAMERAGEELLAIVHSHPASAAQPSPTDRRAAALYPRVLHLIATLRDPEAPLDRCLRAWRVRGDLATEVPLRLT
jgi:proteasome lid subunit RPN8/RPN11